MLLGRNQSAVMPRMTRWSGASMWISVRSSSPCSAWRCVGLVVLQHRPRGVAELVRVELDLEHVGVLGEGPERGEVGVLDAGGSGASRRSTVQASWNHASSA